jgi:hypothetical protein
MSCVENPFSPLSRRDFIRRVTAASMVAAGVPAQIAPASEAGFSTAQRASLKLVLNHLIPATDRLPGAGDLGVAAFVERAATAAAPIREAVAEVLASIAGANPGLERNYDVILREVEQLHPQRFATVLQTAYTGYYSSPAVTAVLGWNDPSEGAGFVPFDPILLPHVQIQESVRDDATPAHSITAADRTMLAEPNRRSDL